MHMAVSLRKHHTIQTTTNYAITDFTQLAIITSHIWFKEGLNKPAGPVRM